MAQEQARKSRSLNERSREVLIRQLSKHRNIVRLFSILTAIGFWWIVSLFFPPILIPGPIMVANKIVEIVLEQNFFFHMYHTFYRVLISFVLALTMSTAIGIIMGTSELGEMYFETYVLIGLTVPALAIGMITLMLFGIGDLAAISGIFLVVLPIMTQNMWQGTKNLDQSLIRMSNAFSVNRSDAIRQVVLPQLVPYILAASRFGLGIGWKIAVIVEMLGLGNGIGYMINQAFLMFSIEGVLAWTLSFTALMALIEFGIIKQIEAYLTRWQQDIEGGTITMT